MTQRRLPASFRSFLLVFSCFVSGITSHSFADEAISEAAPSGAKIDVDNQNEPSVEFDDSSDSPFKTVSRRRRKPSNDPLIELCKETVEVTSRRMLSTEQHTPWQMIHALLGLRNDFSILHNGSPVSGLDWIAQGQTYENEYWFERTRHGGRAHPYSRPYAFEGHANQTIALISMCGVELDRQFGTSDGSVTMRDMIRHAQMTVAQKDEPTWTLWVLSRYLPPNARWVNQDGENWSIERLVQEQVAKPMKGAPCGGTHGLFALAHARNVYLQQGKPLRGVWLQAEYKIRKYINTARFQQNSDGSLSSNYFRGREYNPDFNKRMASIGHMLEFLMIALPQKELNSQWVRRAINSAATELMNNRKAYVKCSPLYHTVNALNIYLDRVNPAMPVEIAIQKDRVTVQTEKAKSSKVPVRTVSRPRPVPAETTTEAEEAQSLPPVVEEAAEVPPAVIEPKAVEPKAAKLKPMPRETTPLKDDGKWKATAKDRQVPLTPVPEDRIGGPAPSETGIKHQKSDDVAPVTIETDEVLAPVIESEPLSIPNELPQPVTESQPVTASQPVTDSQPVKVEAPAKLEVVPEAPVLEAPEAPAVEEVLIESPAIEDAPLEVAEPAVSSLEIPDLTEPVMAEVVEPAKTAAVAATTAVAFDKFVATESAESTASSIASLASATEAIVAALGVRRGMVVADVGSGNGDFVGPLAEAVGSDGHVYAIESSARLVDQLDQRVLAEELANVDVVRNDSKSLQLMHKRVDMVFLCDAYQHLEDRSAIIDSIRLTLLPGGEFILVDSRPTGKAAVRSTLIDEIVAAGFDYVADVNVPGVETGNYLRFKRPF